MIRLMVIKLKQYMDIVPVLLFWLHAIMYLWYVKSSHYPIDLQTERMYWILKHFAETNVFIDIALIYLSFRDRWHPLPKLCAFSLLLLWINNIPPIVFDYEPEACFHIFAATIYSTGMVFSLAVLTQRWRFKNNGN